jgi:DNA-binding MarR family transcriptional regulator
MVTQEFQMGVLPDGGRLLPVLSERQAKCLRFVYDYAVERRDYPLGTEIAEHMGISKQAVTPLVNTLAKKGYVVRDRALIQRNIRLTAEAMEKMARESGSGLTSDMFITGGLPQAA